MPDCLRWLFTPLGRQFFLGCDWSVKSDSSDGVYTSHRNPGRSCDGAEWSRAQDESCDGRAPSRSPSSRPGRPAAPLLLQEAAGQSCPHAGPAAERLRRRQAQEGVWVRPRRRSAAPMFGIWPLNLFLLLCGSRREFSSVLEFLQLLNSCTEDSPSPPPPFSSPLSHSTTPGRKSPVCYRRPFLRG